MLMGLKLHDTRFVAFDEKVTIPVKPFSGDTVMVSVPEAPPLKLSDELFVDRIISGVALAGIGVNVKVAVVV